MLASLALPENQPSCQVQAIPGPENQLVCSAGSAIDPEPREKSGAVYCLGSVANEQEVGTGDAIRIEDSSLQIQHKALDVVA